MQRLFVKQRVNGKETMIPVSIVRSWIQAGGKQVYLHASGVYGDKAGAPVVTADDLNVIPAGPQRIRAMDWWQREGKAMAAEHMARQLRYEDAMATPAASQDDAADLDTALYCRRKGNKAASKPKTWSELGFVSRPQWWGSASQITFADGYTYLLYVSPAGEAEEEKEKADPDIGPGEGKNEE